MYKKKYFYYIFSFVLYIAIGIYSIISVTNRISQEYFDTLGYKAVDIAKIVSNRFYITNHEITELMSLDFRDLLEHPANKRFNELFKGGEFSNNFRFAYILTGLKPEQIKYYVTDDNAEHFDAAPGTPLDMLWLVDAVINQGEYEEDYYDDINRYSYMRENDLAAYKERKQTFIVTRDEYGNAITGYVPIYTVENEFAGMLGIDISFDKFEKYVKSARLSFILIFLLPTLLLTLVFMLVLLRNIRNSRIEASTDPLTSLYNRRFLKNTLPSIIEKHFTEQHNLSVIMLDIDFFKNYNDNYGHQMGDKVLIEISKAISSALRRELDVVCRYGGEEIIVILKNTKLHCAVIVAKRIKNAIDRLCIEHKYSAVSDHVTISQGIYSAIPLKPGIKTEEQFINYADMALYEAKKSGRNKYMVYGNNANFNEDDYSDDDCC